MDPALATITMFAADFAPQGWAFCSGQLLQISQNQALFSLLGTTFGGNGTTNFALPDLRGRTPLGTGQGPGLSNINLGQAFGVENATLSVNQMPSHSHTGTLTVGVSSNPANSDEADTNVLAQGSIQSFKTGAALNGAMAGTTATLANTGSSQAFNLRQPYLGINFIICLSGIFPSRN